MRLLVELTGVASQIAGTKEVHIELDEGSRYSEIIYRLYEQFHALAGVMITEDGRSLLSSVILSRNGSELIMPDQMEDSPKDGDRLSFIFVIVGG
jgi:hypothetical protein